MPFLLQCMKVKSESEVAQSCPTLSDPMDCSLPGSSVHGIFQARVLEWGATAFSNKDTSESESRSVMSDSLQLHGNSIQSVEFFRPEYWSGCPFPSPGDLPSPKIKLLLLCLLHRQVDSLPLALPGKPKRKRKKRHSKQRKK